MKVFLDTNVLVSGFATRGLCADVIRLVVAEHELVIGEVVLDELETISEPENQAASSRHQRDPCFSGESNAPAETENRP